MYIYMYMYMYMQQQLHSPPRRHRPPLPLQTQRPGSRVERFAGDQAPGLRPYMISQRAQYPLIKEYGLNHKGLHIMI